MGAIPFLVSGRVSICGQGPIVWRGWCWTPASSPQGASTCRRGIGKEMGTKDMPFHIGFAGGYLGGMREGPTACFEAPTRFC